jgi:SAM-dependent methyltransferase
MFMLQVLEKLDPGRALDLAAGSGRHSVWLGQLGWRVTAVDLKMDLKMEPLPGIECIHADLERHEYTIEPDAWDLILCWLYWQEDLMPSLAAGVRPGGVAAVAGKMSGRFATSLAQYRKYFQGWEELASGEEEGRAYLIVRRAGPNRPLLPV